MNYTAELNSLLKELLTNGKREEVLKELLNYKDKVKNFSFIIWEAPCVPVLLFEEILISYKYIMPPTLTQEVSERVSKTLLLLECLAEDENTRYSLIESNIPIFMYPILNSNHASKPFEQLRMYCLNVIIALVDNCDGVIHEYFLNTEIIPLCLKILETNCETNKILATLIIERFILEPVGLEYICQTFERFHVVLNVLVTTVSRITENTSQYLIKHLLRCINTLTDVRKNSYSLIQNLPDLMIAEGISDFVKDPESKEILRKFKMQTSSDKLFKFNVQSKKTEL